jgi:hypothetical protein
MKIAFAPVVFRPKPLTIERSSRKKSAAILLLGQSLYLFAITAAMIGWIWLLTSTAIELFFY